jgi:RNA polymerase sigma-70 factor (ECF subfamily)
MIAEKIINLGMKRPNNRSYVYNDIFVIANQDYFIYTYFKNICNFLGFLCVINNREMEMQMEDDAYSKFSDEELLKKAKDSDMKAFDHLHKRYQNRILNYVYRFLGNYQIAEDITQDTFLRIYTNLDNCEIGNVGGWIYTIARNLSFNQLRKQKHKLEISLYTPVSEGEGELIDYLTDDSSSYKAMSQQKELELDIQRAINSLSPKYREVLILCGLQGFSYEEAAKILRCTTRNIGIRLYRARKLMHKIFGSKERRRK